MPLVIDIGGEPTLNVAPSPRPRVPHSHANSFRSPHAYHAPPSPSPSSHSSKRRHAQKLELQAQGGRSKKCRNWCLFFLLLLIQVPILMRFFGAGLPLLEDGRPQKQAYATLLCDDGMAEACGVTVHSLRRSGTRRDVVVLAAANVSDASVAMLTQLGARVERIAAPVPYPFEASAGRQAINKPCRYSKLLVWNLTSYDKVVYLDSDMLVVRNVDELFARPHLAAVPDSVPPDRFNSGLMVLRPSRAVFDDMLVKVNITASPNVGDQGFLNEYFPEWYKEPAAHHLEYGYNAIVRLSASVTWNAWVEPQLRVIHFSGEGKPWNMKMDGAQPAERRFDRMWWAAYYAMYEALAKQGQATARLSAHCRSDYTEYGRNPPAATDKRISVVLNAADERLDLLEHAVKKYAGMKLVHTIYIVWNNAQVDLNLGPASEAVSKPIELVVSARGSPNDRFKPIRSMETDCVLVCDHNVEISEEVLTQAYRRWRDNAYRLVGFFPRAHYFKGGATRGAPKGPVAYVSSPRVEYSMVLPRIALLHADYLRAYTCQTPPGVREFVEENRDCMHVALNFLVSHLSGQPPLLVVDPSKKDYGSSDDGAAGGGAAGQLAADGNGTFCLRALEELWGAMPLRNTSEAVGLYRNNWAIKSAFAGKVSKATRDEFAPVFDFAGAVSKHPDENLKFMPQVEVTLRLPEVSVVPSELTSQRSILCVTGNDSATPTADNGNAYALVDFARIPAGAVQLLGTSFICLSRHGFDDKPLQLYDLLGNLFQYQRDHSGFQAARLLLYKRAALVTSVSDASLALAQALLGSHLAPAGVPEAARPVCFEKAVVIRRNRGALAERPGLMAAMRESIYQFCAGGRPISRFRITIVDDARAAGRGRLANVAELAAELRKQCADKCRPFVVAFNTNSSFCHQVRAMKTAAIVIGAHGEALASSINYMAPDSVVIELSAPANGKNPASKKKVEFREYIVDKAAIALGLKSRYLTMPERAQTNSPAGFVVKADVALVAKVALEEVQNVLSGKYKVQPPPQPLSS